MDGIKYAVFTEKSIRLLGNNQYTSNVESGSTRTEIKHWVEARGTVAREPGKVYRKDSSFLFFSIILILVSYPGSVSLFFRDELLVPVLYFFSVDRR